MSDTGKMRAFIIKFLYIAIWAGIVYFVLKYAMPLFMPFVIAFLIAFLLKPLINRIAARVPVNRKVVAVVVLVLVYAVLGTLLTLAGTRLVVQISKWFAELPRLYQQYIEPAAANISQWFDGFAGRLDPAVASFFDTAAESISSAISSIVSAISAGAINFVSSIATGVPWFVVAAFLAIVASFFFVVDYYKITNFIVAQLSENGRSKLFTVKNFVVNVLWRFVRAYLILMALTFTEVAIGLTILRVPNALLIAFFTALVDVLPVFGTGAVMIPWILYNFFVGDYGLGAGLAIIYGIITVVRQIVEPRVVGKQIGLYPLLTLICMFIGTQMFGFWGLFGLPVAVTVLIHLNRSGEIHLFKEPPYQTVTVNPDQTVEIEIRDDPDEDAVRRQAERDKRDDKEDPDG